MSTPEGYAVPVPTPASHDNPSGERLSAADWDALFSGQRWGRWPHEGVVRAFARTAGTQTSLRVLDIGCGPGSHLGFVEAEGHRGWGVDISAVALEQAAARLRSAGHEPRLTQGAATALPFPAVSFDVVLDVEVFTYLGSEMQSAWKEAARVLAPGGAVISVGFGRRCDPGLAEYLRHCDPRSEDEILALVRGAGLVVVDQQVQMRTHGPEHRWIEEIVTLARLP